MTDMSMWSWTSVNRFLLTYFPERSINGRTALGTACLWNCEESLQQAKFVVALDADLGWVSCNSLPKLAATKTKEKPVHLWWNRELPNKGQRLELYQSDRHLVAEFVKAVSEGKRSFVASNSKARVGQLHAILNDKYPGKKSILITADTVSEPQVKQFLADPGAETLKYDVILTSPTMGTGVDITFPNRAQKVDVVFGFCEPETTTHLEFDQQLGRVWHPGAVKVWVTPRKFYYETDEGVVRRDILERNLFLNFVDGYDEETGEPIYNKRNDIFLEMASLIGSEQRASKNSLREHFIQHKERQGVIVKVIEKDAHWSNVGKGLTALGRSLSNEQHRDRLLRASSLPRADYDRVEKALRNGESVTQSVLASFDRTKLELFYRREITSDLIALDDRGRYRDKVELFFWVSDHSMRALSEAFEEGKAGVRPTRTDEACPPSQHSFQPELSLMTSERFDVDVVFSQSELRELARTISRARTALESWNIRFAAILLTSPFATWGTFEMYWARA